MNKKAINILFLIVFIDMLGFGLIIPLLPYLVGNLGASGLFATCLLSIFSLMQFIFSPILGKLSDRYGRRPVLLICLFGSVISYFLYSIAFFITSNVQITLWIIFCTRLFAGIMGANIPIAYAYIADKVPSSQRTEAMGKIGAAFGLGFILGPAIATLLTPFGPAGLGFCAMLICFINFVWAYLFLEESKDITSQRNNNQKIKLSNILAILKDNNICILIFISLFYSFAFVQMESIFSLFAGTAYKLNQTQIGWTFVYLGIIIAISQGILVGKLSIRVGDINLLLSGMVLLGLSFLLVYSVKNIWFMFIGMGGIALGAGAINPTLSAIISRSTEDDKQGLMQGINHSASSLARIIGPITAGLLYDNYSPASPFLLGAFLAFLVIATVLFVKFCFLNKSK